MQIKYGTSRIVLLLPMLGLAIKFPRVYARIAFGNMWDFVRNRQWSDLYAFFFEYDYEQTSFSYFILKGFIDNLSERRFYRRTRNSYAWPTFFSLYGALNIQILGNTLGRESKSIYKKIYSIVGQNIIRDGHCFENGENFCRSKDGNVYLLDYASRTSQEILSKHGEELRSAFQDLGLPR